MMEYAEWIKSYIASHSGFVRGRCAEATLAMVAVFGELRRVAGFVHVTWLGTSDPDRAEQHWWCVAPDGSIVDPTRAQFASALIHRYEELDLSNPSDRARIPSGRCGNCGDDTFSGAYLCDRDECARAFAADLGVPLTHVVA